MSISISEFAIVKSNVILGDNTIVEELCILGIKPKNSTGDLIIGSNSVIRAGTYLYLGITTGDNLQTGNKANIRENCKIGKNVSIGSLSILERDVVIGDNSRIHSNVFIPEYTKISKNVWIGPCCVFTNDKYPPSGNLVGATVEENVIIGANCTILPGITIGEGSFIGAGSIITKDVPPNSRIKGKH